MKHLILIFAAFLLVACGEKDENSHPVASSIESYESFLNHCTSNCAQAYSDYILASLEQYYGPNDFSLKECQLEPCLNPYDLESRYRSSF